MQIFKTYFTIMKKYIGVISIYLGVFMAIAIILVQAQKSDENTSFSAEKLTIGIVDHDTGTMTESLKDYFGASHTFKKMKDNKKTIMEELYWRKTDYVLVIPKGFEESLSTKTPKELSCMKVPGYFEASYFESELDMYLSKLTGLIASGYSVAEAQQMLEGLKENEADVKMASFVNKKQGDVNTKFFLLVPYLFLSVAIVGVGTVLLKMNEKEIKDRTECSATTLKERVAGTTAGIFVFGAILFVCVLIVDFILSKGTILTDKRLPYFMLNMFAMLLFSLSVAFLTGMAAKNKESVNGIVNIVGLALCFFGGVFVPQEFFGKGVEKVARFFPTYWYVKNNEQIGEMSRMSSELRNSILSQTGLIVCYALAIFAITLVFISTKRKRNA
ncbi:MAG: ABC transporter permease [Lachnospiraceae bacterium]